MNYLLSSQFCDSENEDSERQSKFPKFTELWGGKARILTQIKSLAIFHCLYLTFALLSDLLIASKSWQVFL